jgi:hypothetical protein
VAKSTNFAIRPNSMWPKDQFLADISIPWKVEARKRKDGLLVRIELVALDLTLSPWEVYRERARRNLKSKGVHQGV